MKFRQLSFIVLICFVINLILGGIGYAVDEGQSQKNEIRKKCSNMSFLLF